MCAAVPVRALLQLPLLGVERGYKGLYGGGWPLRGMGAAGTALGAADARMNEHYEIGTILTQKSQGGVTVSEGDVGKEKKSEGQVPAPRGRPWPWAGLFVQGSLFLWGRSRERVKSVP